ncbi:Arginine metabolism regulation protein I [Dictyocoela muelleri]|nr:Arginine metabolism regulation protein I [Dictyocoela muelleri]
MSSREKYNLIKNRKSNTSPNNKKCSEADDFLLNLEPKKGVRRKLPFTYIKNRASRNRCFSRRRNGLIKKANDLNILTGTGIILYITSEWKTSYSFVSNDLKTLHDIIRKKFDINPEEAEKYSDL